MARPTTATRPATGTAVATTDPGNSKLAVFRQELTLRESQFRPLLPAHVSIDKFKAVVISAVASNPKLLECTQPSLFKACREAAELGLSLNPSLGEGDILPVWNSRISANEAQFRPRYMGLMKLARQSGEIAEIQAHAVRKGDTFEYEYGLNPKLIHRPGEKRAELSHVYCVWATKDGVRSFEVMDRDQVLAIRQRSPAKGGTVGPWVTDEEEMWRKTVVRRASKYMPRSADAFQKAVAADGLHEAGKPVDFVEGEIITEAEDITAPPATDAAEKQMDGLEQRMTAAAPDVVIIPVPEIAGKPDFRGWADSCVSAIQALPDIPACDAWAKAHKSIVNGAEFNAPDEAARVIAAMKAKRGV